MCCFIDNNVKVKDIKIINKGSNMDVIMESDKCELEIEYTTEINKNSEEIENLSFQPFELQVNDIYNNFILGYFNNINKDIYQYCNEEEGYNNSYFKNLMEKKEQNKEYYSRRRLVESSNEDDIANEAKKRIESKDVEETLDQLLNKTNNVLKYIDNINTFLTYERKIKDFQNNLNIDYKNIKEMIIKNQYIHEIDLYLKQKLINITHILSSYYKNINSLISSFSGICIIIIIIIRI